MTVIEWLLEYGKPSESNCIRAVGGGVQLRNILVDF